MKSKEPIIIGIIVLFCVAILAALYFYQKGQTTVINKSLTTTNGLKVTLGSSTFRAVDEGHTNLIIKAKIENTTNKAVIPFSATEVGNPPVSPILCSDYSYNYQNPDRQCVKTDSKEYFDYQTQYTEYQTKLRDAQDAQKTGYATLKTPKNSTAEISYSQVGGKQDLSTILNSDYRTINSKETIEGILVYSLDEAEKGLYSFEYKGNAINFEIK